MGPRRHKGSAVAATGLRRAFAGWPGGPRQLKYPETLYLRITAESNHALSSCGLWAQAWRNQSGTRRQELTDEEWISFCRAQAPRHPYVFLDGGEPLLREGCARLVRSISELGGLCGLRTNGLLLRERAGELVDAGLDYLLCTLPEDVQADSGEHAGQAALEGVRRTLEVRAKRRSRLPLVQLTVPLTVHTQHELLGLAECAQALGVDVFAISLPVFTTRELALATSLRLAEEFGCRAHHWQAFVIDLSGIDRPQVADQLAKIRSRRWRFVYRQFPAVAPRDVARYLDNPAEVMGRARSCRLPFCLAVVLPNGDVATCWDHPDYVTGNVRTQAFLAIWQGERYGRFRRTLQGQLLPSCPRCHGLYY